MVTAFPLFGPIPGGPEMLVILLLAVLLFGANKIPKLARSTGTAIGEFRKGRKEVEQELQEMEEAADTTTDMTESTADTSPDQTDDSGESDIATASRSNTPSSGSQERNTSEQPESEVIDT